MHNLYDFAKRVIKSCFPVGFLDSEEMHTQQKLTNDYYARRHRTRFFMKMVAIYSLPSYIITNKKMLLIF